MSTMQAFYNRINQASEIRDQHLQNLSQLTQASAADLVELKSGADWITWSDAN